MELIIYCWYPEKSIDVLGVRKIEVVRFKNEDWRLNDSRDHELLNIPRDTNWINLEEAIKDIKDGLKKWKNPLK